MGVKITNKGIINLYSWNYVLVVVFSGLLYFVFTIISPVPVRTDDEDLGKLYLIDGLEPEVTNGVASGDEGNMEEGNESEKNGFKSGRASELSTMV
jgi:nucleobase:cation symporter-1, NCS1 family